MMPKIVGRNGVTVSVNKSPLKNTFSRVYTCLPFTLTQVIRLFLLKPAAMNTSCPGLTLQVVDVQHLEMFDFFFRLRHWCNSTHPWCNSTHRWCNSTHHELQHGPRHRHLLFPDMQLTFQLCQFDAKGTRLLNLEFQMKAWMVDGMGNMIQLRTGEFKNPRHTVDGSEIRLTGWYGKYM